MAGAAFGQRTVLDACFGGDVVMTTQVSARSTRLAWVLWSGPRRRYTSLAVERRAGAAAAVYEQAVVKCERRSMAD